MAHCDRIRPDAKLSASLKEGELRLYDGENLVLDKVFVQEKEAPFALAVWRQWLRKRPTLDPETISSGLRKWPGTDNKAIVEQVVQLDSQAVQLEGEISQLQEALDDHVLALLDLTDKEVSIIRRGSW